MVAVVTAVVTALVALLAGPSSVLCMRGPHHPRGHAEVSKHHHYRPSPEDQHTKLIHDEQLLQDKEHIREDLGGWATQEAVDKMTPDELQFHYFKLHDLDENIKLDGLEILRAIMHTEEHDHAHEDEDQDHDGVEDQVHEHEAHDGDTNAIGLNDEPDKEKRPVPVEYYIELIDEVLREDDTDNDGYLSYAEYVVGRNQSKRLLAAERSERG